MQQPFKQPLERACSPDAPDAPPLQRLLLKIRPSKISLGRVIFVCALFCTLTAHSLAEIYIANLCSRGIQYVSNHADHTRSGDLQTPETNRLQSPIHVVLSNVGCKGVVNLVMTSISILAGQRMTTPVTLREISSISPADKLSKFHEISLVAIQGDLLSHN
jgi:hypothetical protein